jgi:P pilus assembly chaperone PapD
MISEENKLKNIVVMMTLAFAFSSSPGNADIVVDESIIVMGDAAQSKRDVTVYNNDESANLYLEVTPFEVYNPGEENESLEPLSLNSNPEFLVSPNRAIIPPGSPSILRLLNLQTENDEERIYRINLVPAVPPMELQPPGTQAVASALQVVVAYQILVIILPSNPQALVAASRQGNAATFSNAGNSNYLLTEGEQCNPADPRECVALESRRIYAGNSWTLELPFDGPARYTARTQEGTSSVEF